MSTEKMSFIYLFVNYVSFFTTVTSA